MKMQLYSTNIEQFQRKDTEFVQWWVIYKIVQVCMTLRAEPVPWESQSGKLSGKLSSWFLHLIGFFCIDSNLKLVTCVCFCHDSPHSRLQTPKFETIYYFTYLLSFLRTYLLITIRDYVKLWSHVISCDCVEWRVERMFLDVTCQIIAGIRHHNLSIWRLRFVLLSV